MRMLCKKCHTEMTVMQEDNVSGLICPKCGWNIVTTKIDDIMLDTQLYQLYILKNEHINRNQIRILSKISGMNYICIKQNIVTRNKTLLISDRAFKIKAIKEMLEKEKIQFEVVPEFKYWMLRKQFLKEIVYMWVEKSGRKAALW